MFADQPVAGNQRFPVGSGCETAITDAGAGFTVYGRVGACIAGAGPADAVTGDLAAFKLDSN